MQNYKRVVMLKEKTGSRFLPIWIGHFEADAIAIPMQNVPVSRPLTHDLLGAVITSLGGKVTQVVINELADETFFASEGDAEEATSEARPAPAEVIDESKLGVFKEFIETLDLGDLGRGGGE